MHSTKKNKNRCSLHRGYKHGNDIKANLASISYCKPHITFYSVPLYFLENWKYAVREILKRKVQSNTNLPFFKPMHCSRALMYTLDTAFTVVTFTATVIASPDVSVTGEGNSTNCAGCVFWGTEKLQPHTKEYLPCPGPSLHHTLFLASAGTPFKFISCKWQGASCWWWSCKAAPFCRLVWGQGGVLLQISPGHSCPSSQWYVLECNVRSHFFYFRHVHLFKCFFVFCFFKERRINRINMITLQNYARALGLRKISC